MKKYIVKFKGSGKLFGVYASQEEASLKVVEYINDSNDDLEGDYVSPFDFVLEEVECKEVNEVITDFETARKFLGIKPNDEFTVVRKKHSESDIQFDDVESLVDDINPKHIEALIALNKLFTIADAWNKEDGFVPDFSDYKQQKWFPLFDYTNDAGFVYATTSYITSHATVPLSPRLYFKTRERATQFGEQFADLYNKVFL